MNPCSAIALRRMIKLHPVSPGIFGLVHGRVGPLHQEPDRTGKRANLARSRPCRQRRPTPAGWHFSADCRGCPGRGLQNRLAVRGVQVVVTTVTDPDQAVADWLKGELAICTAPPHDCEHDGHHHGNNQCVIGLAYQWAEPLANMLVGSMRTEADRDLGSKKPFIGRSLCIGAMGSCAPTQTI